MSFVLPHHLRSDAPRRCGNGSPRGRAGFSLFELVLVMAMIGIISAMAIPRYGRSLSNYRAQCAAQRIATDLRAAAAHAVATSTSRTVSFDVGQNEYHIVGMSGMENRDQTWRVLLGAEPYSASLVSVDLGGGNAIVFNGYGAPDRGGSIVVRSGDFARTIQIDPDTGRATIQ